MITVCDKCGHVRISVDQSERVVRSVRRVITVLSAHPEGLRRNDLRRKIGKPYRLELVEVLDRLESEQMITRTDHLIKLIKGSTS